jgi:hypothetical protein
VLGHHQRHHRIPHERQRLLMLDPRMLRRVGGMGERPDQLIAIGEPVAELVFEGAEADQRRGGEER